MNLSTYLTIKHQLWTGDVLLYSGKGVIPDLIEDISYSVYSHAGLVIGFNDYPGELFTIEALAEGVVMSELNGRLAGDTGQCTVFPLLSTLTVTRAEVGLRALKRLRMRYAFDVLLRLSFEKVPLVENGETVCSELVQECLGIGGDILTPGDLSKLDVFTKPIKL